MRVVRVVGPACADGRDVEVEDDVRGPQGAVRGEGGECAAAHAQAISAGGRGAALVARHDDGGRAEAGAALRGADERGLAVAEREAADERAPRHARERGLYRVWVRRVDDDGHARHRTVARARAEERRDRRAPVDHRVVYAHVQQVAPLLDLCVRHFTCAIPVPGSHSRAKRTRPRHRAPFPGNEQPCPHTHNFCPAQLQCGRLRWGW